MKTVTAVPAYSRDYKSKAAVLADWEAGKDFTLSTFDMRPTYGSCRDSLTEFDAVQFRYAKQTKTFIHKLVK